MQARTVAIIRERSGGRPYGWRSCTQSSNSIELLMKHGFLWNSNSFSHVWKDMFDEFHEESTLAPTYVPFQFHPYISGRPGRARTMRTIIRHMKNAEGTWLATGSEVACWCLDEIFKADAAKIAQA